MHYDLQQTKLRKKSIAMSHKIGRQALNSSQSIELSEMGNKLKGVQSHDFLLKALFSLKAFNRKETSVLF